MPSLTLRKLSSLLKTAAALALTASALVAIQALSAPGDKPVKHEMKAHVAKVRTHRAFKQAPSTGPFVLIGEKQTVSADPDWAGTDWEDNGIGAVELTCPGNRRAISGGFQAPDSAGVLLNGSHPGSSPSSWIIEVTYFGDGQSANWIPNVTCI